MLLTNLPLALEQIIAGWQSGEPSYLVQPVHGFLVLPLKAYQALAHVLVSELGVELTAMLDLPLQGTRKQTAIIKKPRTRRVDINVHTVVAHKYGWATRKKRQLPLR